jgi:hypothetical protein
MTGDSDIQVWLDSMRNAAQAIVTPHIKTAKDMQVIYQLTLIQSGNSGNSRISQSGTVDVHKANATPLSRVSISPKNDGECRLEITVRQGEQALGTYRFDCPH